MTLTKARLDEPLITYGDVARWSLAMFGFVAYVFGLWYISLFDIASPAGANALILGGACALVGMALMTAGVVAGARRY